MRQPLPVAPFVLSLGLLFCAGCPEGGDPPDPPGVDDDDHTGGDDDDDVKPPCSDTFNLEVVGVDIWGLDLPQYAVEVLADGTPLAQDDALVGPLEIPVGEPATFRVDITESGEFEPATARLTWNGGPLPDSLVLEQPDWATGARALHAWEVREGDGETCPTATLYLGLDHRWFAATGRPARRDNALDLLLNGEASWASLYDDLLAADESIHHSVWYWMSHFELIRGDDHVTSTETERERLTSMYLLEQQNQATKRLLVNRFYDGWDWIDILYTDSDLRMHAETPGDGFEVMLHPNGTDVPLVGDYEGEAADFCFRDRLLDNPLYADAPLLDEPCHDMTARDYEVPAASWHQKFWVFDSEVAYVGGMNTKTTDWDSEDHLVFDPRRMEIDADTDERVGVQNREQEPDFGPRRDYMIRVEGPSVTDVEDVFHTRWEHAHLTDAAYAECVTTFAAPEYSGGLVGDSFAQITVTMPEPWAEMSILESWAKAVSQAEEYIFIEDQYWRAPSLNDYLIATLLEKPWVKLIVVSKPVADYDGGSKYSYLTDQLFLDLVPDQYLLLQLKAFDVVIEEGTFWDTRDLYFQDIDTHSKMLIVDDRYMSVGSANKNNRGVFYDGEMNVAVLDDLWVRDERQRLFENLVGPEMAHLVTDDADANFELLRGLAEDNDDWQTTWETWIDVLEIDVLEDYAGLYAPYGFLYTLEFDDTYWFDVGPDMF
jgi:phosphatidylserine/phosphatidylglycerophosphate/cardiolipin synthase-like enzyme